MDYRIKENFEELVKQLPWLDESAFPGSGVCAPTAKYDLDASTLARYIDHTMLKPDATPAMLDKLCREAMENGFFSVCVNPVHVRRASLLLDGSSVAVCTVIGFPLGANCKETKADETIRAVDEGATEVDMVMNIGFLKACDYKGTYDDIKAVTDTARPFALTKVIIETCLLTDDEKVKASMLSKAAGAGFVKTSTGFSASGATAADIRLMRAVVGSSTGVKASGGIRDTASALDMIEAGATRLGASAGIAIIEGLRVSCR